jgi:predicted permease
LPYVIATDLRYAMRALVRSPVFSLTVLVTLALVIGVNTAVISLAYAILIEPLPYPGPEQLAYVNVSIQTAEGESSIDAHDGTTWELLRDRASGIDVAITVGGSGLGLNANLSVDDVVSTVGQERVSAGFFHVLGVAPLIGREFIAQEDTPAGPAVAVLSYQLWQQLFQGEPSALGKTMLLRGEPYEVIGVMPQQFRSMTEGIDVWTPVRPSRTGEGGGTNYGVIARLRPGYSWPEASSGMPPVDSDYFRRVMGRNWADAEPTGRFTLVPMQKALTAADHKPLIMLVAAAAAVLLIACVNLSTLLVTRSVGRRKEIAIRMSIGSGRGTVVRQLFMECLLLGALGGALGLVVSWAGLVGLKIFGATTFSEWADVNLDARALAVTAGLALITSVLFGLLPTVQASRLNVCSALADGAHSIAGQTRHRPRQLLVGTQIVLSIVLLIVAGLLIRTFVNLRSLDPGFDTSSVTTTSVSLQDARYDSSAKMNRLFDESLTQIEATPGIVSAAVSLELPYRRLLNMNFAFADEVTPTAPRIANVMYATPGFFETLRIPLQVGRFLEQTDTASTSPVVVVSKDFVDIAARGDNPIGRRLRIAGVEREIVGVVGSIRVTESGFFVPGMLEGPVTSGPLVYLPAAQTPDSLMAVHVWFSPMWTVRSQDRGVAEAALRQAITSADPLLPIGSVRRISDLRAEATAEQELLMLLVVVLAGGAMLLSAVGIYGLVAHSVGEREREFGLRIALGATATQTARSAALSGLALTGIAGTVGLGLAWMIVRTLDTQSILWGVSSRDPATFLSAAAVLLVAAAIASVLPAIRILRLDMTKTLRA